MWKPHKLPIDYEYAKKHIKDTMSDNEYKKIVTQTKTQRERLAEIENNPEKYKTRHQTFINYPGGFEQYEKDVENGVYDND